MKEIETPKIQPQVVLSKEEVEEILLKDDEGEDY